MYIIYKIHSLQNVIYKHIYIYLHIVSVEGHGNSLQHSCLENPMDRGPWSMGLKDLDTTEWLTHTHTLSLSLSRSLSISIYIYICMYVCMYLSPLIQTPKLWTFRDVNVHSHVQSHASLHVWRALSVLYNRLCFCVIYNNVQIAMWSTVVQDLYFKCRLGRSKHKSSRDVAGTAQKRIRKWQADLIYLRRHC